MKLVMTIGLVCIVFIAWVSTPNIKEMFFGQSFECNEVTVEKMGSLTDLDHHRKFNCFESKWIEPFDHRLDSAPLFSDGNVLVAGQSLIYSLDCDDGAKKWIRKDNDIQIRALPALAFSNGVAYYGNWKSYLYAIDVNENTENWSFKHEMACVGCPLLLEGSIYFGCDDGCLYSLNSDTGDVNWKKQLNVHIGLKVAEEDGLLYVVSIDNNLMVLNRINGTVESSRELQDEVVSGPFVSNGVIYLRCKETGLNAYDVKTCNKSWADDLASYSKSPSFYDDLICYSCRNHSVTVRTGKTGKEKWSYKFNNTISAPLIADDKVFVGSYDRHLYVLSLEEGDLLSVIEMDGYVMFPPAVHDKMLYVVCNEVASSKLCAIEMIE